MLRTSLLSVAALGLVAVATTGSSLWTAGVGLVGLLVVAMATTRHRALPPAPTATVLWQPDAMQALLATSEDGVLVLDHNGRALAGNGRCRQFLELPPGVPLEGALLERADWPQLAAAVAAVRVPGGQPTTFATVRGTGGDAIEVDVRVAAAPDSGIAIVVMRDQSRLRQLETHRRDFVANVSHELKTPLAAMQALLETVLDDTAIDPALARRFLQRAHAQTERLAVLIGDLLELARLDEQLPLAAPPCDFGRVVQDVVRDLQPLAQARGVQFGSDAVAAGLAVAAAREALRQIASNLIDNAIKYTPRGGRVTVRLGRAGDEVDFAVDDTGIGLSPADQRRVFERFYRVDKARSRDLGGTGLGLSIVKHTVQALGGEVAVVSELGRGSTFTVRLPLASAPSSA